MPLRGGENLTLVGAHRIQDKCGYLCLTLNALLRIAVCSARDAQNAVIWSTVFRVGHAAVQSYPK